MRFILVKRKDGGPLFAKTQNLLVDILYRPKILSIKHYCFQSVRKYSTHLKAGSGNPFKNSAFQFVITLVGMSL